MLRHPALCASFLAALVLAPGCSSSSASSAPTDGGADAPTGDAPLTDDQWIAQVTQSMHDSLQTDLQALHQAALDIQSAAPTPTGRGWDPTLDAAAITAMETAWAKARTAYEHIEGATAPIFPDIDYSIDARYDDAMATLTPAGDPYLFDNTGFTGMHAIERILYVNVTPPAVVTFESTLPGYVAAAMPATETEASDFKTKLCQQLVTDTETLLTNWTPAQIDLGTAFQGLISLMNEQQEKVNKAASSEEESRYSQTTMKDIRDNLAGTTTIYAIFAPWIATKPPTSTVTDTGVQVNTTIQNDFTTMAGIYATVTGDAIPPCPADWNSESPSAADQATPFGVLYEGVHNAVDPSIPGSMAYEMNEAAVLLGYPEFQKGQ